VEFKFRFKKEKKKRKKRKKERKEKKRKNPRIYVRRRAIIKIAGLQLQVHTSK
jgi:hypothetical protein